MGTTKMAEFSGVVVYRKDYRERDMLVKILTDHYGFKMFFVRGARKRGFKLAAAILPFTSATFIGTINDSGLSFISAVKEVKQFQTICNDIVLNAYASYVLGLGEAAFGDAVPLNIWYEKLVHVLKAIDSGIDAAILTNMVEVQMLGFFGVKPNLVNCVVCAENQGEFDFSQSLGGLLCQKHWNMDPQRMHLDKRTIFFLRQFSAVDILKIGNISVKDDTKKNLRAALDQIYNNEVGLNIKAKHFIDEMGKWPKEILCNSQDEQTKD
ncbi:DNA repair protein RecO [Liquorilactobacillus mali]|uniref:DNA repair protein RecO n=1 Tax=Liquorilactobacillus mali KCTC 3596 = DSM 20444 TaxID=1046596 RepID=J0KY03_9LACO|nr:DNA repair protein recO (Recombination protein O) [Liquorilactobacillus mali KCTC 3596 = DSM 20444]KRN08567.1 DNA repair protein [Liquorilactobacillus mali KCTC 3596 = DSM 20444]MDC7952136.1 DNA repair protein RecO [Liquorilactobacillus mali]MDV7756935.1 DNA repair protein RecO [Liquorilactobacillus mali]QFQ74774.1 DNA repair protein RecO [Liquorilactobacillus mali]